MKFEKLSLILETSPLVCTAKKIIGFKKIETLALNWSKKQNSILIWLLKLVLLLSSLRLFSR